MDRLRSKIGCGIRHLREKKGFSLPQLAALGGIPESELERLESGEEDFDILALLRVAPILGISPAGFVGQCEEEADG